MNDLWERVKRELPDAIRNSGRPDLALAAISGALAWVIVGILQILAEIVQSW